MYVSYKDIRALMADLKAVYAAVDEASALEALDVFAGANTFIKETHISLHVP